MLSLSSSDSFFLPFFTGGGAPLLGLEDGAGFLAGALSL